MQIDLRHDRNSREVRRLLEMLPDWFGDPEAIDNYVADAVNPSYWSIFAIVENQVVGVILVARHFPESAEIRLIAADPAHHRKGIGRALVEKVSAELQSDNCHMVSVHTVGPSYVDQAYERTRAFYRSVGFVPLEEHDGLDWGGPTLILVKPLR